MPVGVVRRGEHVVVETEFVELGGVEGIALRVLGVGEVHGDERLRAGLAHGFRPGGHQRRDIGPARFSGEAAVGLVAELDQGDLRAGGADRFKAFLRKGVQRRGLLLERHARPGLGRELLAGVGPKVGIVEVDEKAQAVFRRAAADLGGRRDVAVAAAVAAALRVKGVVPHAHADRVDAALGERGEEILFPAVEAAVHDAAALLGQDAGDVHPEDEVRGEILHLFYIQALRAHGRQLRFLPRGRGAGGKQQRRGQSRGGSR